MPTNNILVTTDYYFVRSAGAACTAGVPYTATLSPVPLGMNIPSTYPYYIRLSDASADEGVLITGGSAVSGASSGTIQFTPASNHGAGFAISSGSNGIQEAVNSAVRGNGVFVPPGDHIVYGPITVPPTTIAFFGEGVNSSVILRNFTTGDLLKFKPTVEGIVTIRDLGLSSYVTSASGAQLNLEGRAAAGGVPAAAFTQGSVMNIYMSAGSNASIYDGLHADSPNGMVFSNITIREVTHLGLEITTDATLAAGQYSHIRRLCPRNQHREVYFA
jgi:hypothetical protein